MAQLVGCWNHSPRVVGSIPTDANCFMWNNILGQDVNLNYVSLHSGENIGTQLYGGLASAPCMAAMGKVTKANYPYGGNTV